MTLSACNFLAAIVAMFPTHLSSLDRLTVDAGCTRRRLAKLPRLLWLRCPLPNFLPQGIHQPLPCAVVTPLLEVIVDGTLRQQVVRQHGPLTARTIEIEDRVDHL